MKPRLSSIKMGRVAPIILISITIFIAVLLSQLTLSTGIYDDVLAPVFSEGGGKHVITNLLGLVAIGIVSIILILLMFKQEEAFAFKVFIVIFIISGTISALVFGNLFIARLGRTIPILHIILAAVMYLGFYSAYLVIADILSGRAKNAIFVIYSAIMGAFLGVIIPALLVILGLLVLSIVDAIWIWRGPLRRVVESVDKPREPMVKMTYSTKEWEIGLGDLISYAMLTSLSLVNFGLSLCVVSVALTLLGSLLTMKLAERRAYVPGLPISVGLGLVPSIIMLLFLI